MQIFHPPQTRLHSNERVREMRGRREENMKLLRRRRCEAFKIIQNNVQMLLMF